MNKDNKKTIRTRKLLVALNEYFNDVAYYDDELEKEVIDDTEKGCYNSIMKDTELHLLGANYVKQMIHIMFTDFELFSIISIKFKAI